MRPPIALIAACLLLAHLTGCLAHGPQLIDATDPRLDALVATPRTEQIRAKDPVSAVTTFMRQMNAERHLYITDLEVGAPSPTDPRLCWTRYASRTTSETRPSYEMTRPGRYEQRVETHLEPTYAPQGAYACHTVTKPVTRTQYVYQPSYTTSLYGAAPIASQPRTVTRYEPVRECGYTHQTSTQLRSVPRAQSVYVQPQWGLVIRTVRSTEFFPVDDVCAPSDPTPPSTPTTYTITADAWRRP